MNILTILANMICLVLQVSADDSFPPPLSKKEEDAAVAAMLAGDEAARAELIEHNLRLVVHIIKKFYAANKDQDDLISIGTVGLIKGINSFDPAKGTKLATYCSRCIENEIYMYFRTLKKQSQEVSFSEPIDTDSEGNPLTLMELISVEDTIVDDLDTRGKLRKLATLVDGITDPRDREILTARYGLAGRRAETQQEIAERLGISRSYVSRIEKRVLSELRSAFRSQ